MRSTNTSLKDPHSLVYLMIRFFFIIQKAQIDHIHKSICASCPNPKIIKKRTSECGFCFIQLNLNWNYNSV